eukprot:1143616-Prorocentrum_minimum.AAC.1
MQSGLLTSSGKSPVFVSGTHAAGFRVWDFRVIAHLTRGRWAPRRQLPVGRGVVRASHRPPER